MAGSKKLRMGTMLKGVDKVFSPFGDPGGAKYSTRDLLMCGLVMFVFKTLKESSGSNTKHNYGHDSRSL